MINEQSTVNVFIFFIYCKQILSCFQANVLKLCMNPACRSDCSVLQPVQFSGGFPNPVNLSIHSAVKHKEGKVKTDWFCFCQKLHLPCCACSSYSWSNWSWTQRGSSHLDPMTFSKKWACWTYWGGSLTHFHKPDPLLSCSCFLGLYFPSFFPFFPILSCLLSSHFLSPLVF